ncbi:MAG: PASTA domain-containing protein, partial [Thermovirgaceae bacterium]|nr:PASTA domain-containing protein [Thermovirgaceae bacterium]
MKLHRTVVTLSLLGILLPGTGFAGALVRGPMQQRYNQAADEMIRVPGVVGMYESDAMAILQQAGVAPNIEYARKFKEDLTGREGTVIDQEPGAGGITMLGSTVTITVYWPASMGPEPGAGQNNGQPANDGGGQWSEPGGAAPPPSNQAPAPQ